MLLIFKIKGKSILCWTWYYFVEHDTLCPGAEEPNPGHYRPLCSSRKIHFFLLLYRLEIRSSNFLINITMSYSFNMKLGFRSFLKKKKSEPWLVWLSALSTSLWTKGSLVWFPVKRSCLACGPGPHLGARERQPHTDVSLPLFLPPLFYKIHNK